MGEVALAFGNLFLNKIAKHEDGPDLILIYHSPKILKG